MSDVLSMPLHDQAARERIATDLETNLLVEAGAGSGKTTALVGRMVALVETGTATADEIAAVTFTRKAASELRERFQMRLEERVRETALDGVDDLVHERLSHALDDIDRVFIGTIHAFCSRLLRERPLEVGLDPAFEELAVEERARVRRQFWESYLERLTRDADPVLEDLATAGLSPGRLWDLFGHMVENPDVDFPITETSMPAMDETKEVRRELEAIVEEGWELMPPLEPPKGWDSLQKKIRTAHFTRDVTDWQTPADFFEALDLLCKSGKNGHKVTQNRWREGSLAKALCAKTNQFAHGDTPARALLDRWYAHRYAMVVRLTRQAAEDFAEHRKRTGRVDFQDLLVLTARLLRTNPGVRRQLGLRYRRLLVDEFQDTDPLQAELMMLLAAEARTDASTSGGARDSEDDADDDDGDAGAGDDANWRTAVPRPGALFVVGDPKQSIYRFRRADIQLYGFVKQRFGAFGDVLNLNTNFRSRPPVGDLVNGLFNEEGFFPTEATEYQAAFERLNTRPVGPDQSLGGVYWYSVAPEKATRDGATEEDAERIASHIAACVSSGSRSAGEFLILTRKRSHLATYARSLEARSLPLEVTGAGVGVELELREFQVLLECMIDPSNPIKVVSALVGLFFGLDYERLVQHRLEQGGFDITGSMERGHPEVLDALRTLGGWWRAAKVQPADIFVSTVVSELGLLPYAASGDLGALRAGALVYALDAVRAAALGGDASLPGALAALQAALDLSEAEAPLEPGRPGVVRLMNLHQAKGLEAPVVFLADPTGASRPRTPDLHMTRSETGDATGYLQVSQSGAYGTDIVLARPTGWPEKEEAERAFAAAEEVRLLYVAVTRAEEELLVARWPAKAKSSPWASLDPWLLEFGSERDLPILDPPERLELTDTAEDILSAETRAQDRLAALAHPTRTFRSVTELAKGEQAVADPAASPGVGGSEAPSGTEGAASYRGYSWGSAVHGALAAAAEGASGDGLRAACRALLIDNARPTDNQGDPVELQELQGAVEAVTRSALWKRAFASDRVLAEVPFASRYTVQVGDAPEPEESAAADVPRKRQLDLFGVEIPDSAESDDEGGSVGSAGAGAEANSPAEGASGSESLGGGTGEEVVLEGVIDLAFREKGGWVIADYKTDLGTDPEFPARSASYRRQVDLYAEAWTRLTGEKVKERVLFYTSQDRIESW